MSDFVIYDNLSPLLSNQPFLAGKTLLEELYITKQVAKDNAHALNYNLFSFNKNLFVKNFLHVILNASKNSENIVVLDDNSYLCLKNVKDILKNQKDILENSCENLCQIVHINSFLTKDEWIKYIKDNVKKRFDNLSACFYMGSDMEKDFYKSEKINELFGAIKLKRVKTDCDFFPSGYDIFESNDKIAKKIAAKVLFEAFDNGADFLIVNDIRTFTFFDSFQKKIAKAYGRDVNLPILTLPQTILLSLGVTDTKILGLNKHFIKPSFI